MSGVGIAYLLHVTCSGAVFTWIKSVVFIVRKRDMVLAEMHWIDGKWYPRAE
jgi:hypothetical protein